MIGIWHVALTVATLGAFASAALAWRAMARRDDRMTYHNCGLTAIFSVTALLSIALIGS